MMFWSDHDMSGWGYTGMAMGMVLFWALIIVAIIALIRFNTGTIRAVTQPQPQSDDESPAKVLASRFARGEIEEPEYQQRLAVLRSTSRR